ncbi:hypothetical protein QYF36_011171 [Acer negundo]|nr:hypothetical protein QYF36_011171 [Acer negundo]
MENSVVGVDDSSSRGGGGSGGGGGGGEGRERGIIPVSVSWEDGWFGVVLDLDDEGFLQIRVSFVNELEQHLQFFHFLGTLLAKAMFKGILVDIPFATFFLSKLKQKYNYLNDLPSLDPELRRHLIFLKETLMLLSFLLQDLS